MARPEVRRSPIVSYPGWALRSVVADVWSQYRPRRCRSQQPGRFVPAWGGGRAAEAVTTTERKHDGEVRTAGERDGTGSGSCSVAGAGDRLRVHRGGVDHPGVCPLPEGRAPHSPASHSPTTQPHIDAEAEAIVGGSPAAAVALVASWAVSAAAGEAFVGARHGHFAFACGRCRAAQS